MNTLIEEIRKRIKAVSDNTDEPGYDEYTTGQGVGLAIALQIIDEVVKEHPVPDDVQEASRNYADKRLLENKRELAESGHTRHFKMCYVCFAGYEIEAAYADGMLAERERMMKEAPVADVVEMSGSIGPFTDYPFMLSLGFRKIPNIEYHGGKVRVIIEEINQTTLK